MGTFLGAKTGRAVAITTRLGPGTATLRVREERSRRKLYLFETAFDDGPGGGPEAPGAPPVGTPPTENAALAGPPPARVGEPATVPPAGPRPAVPPRGGSGPGRLPEWL